MKRFTQYIKENFEEGEVPYNKNPHIGWWNDDKDFLTVYHGTHKRNVDNIKKNGISVPDPRTGMVSTALEPNTAHGYAAMSSGDRRGEHSFRLAGAKAVTTPHEDRAVIKFRIPMHWVRKNVDPNLRGNIGVAADRLSDKSQYDSWKSKNPKGSDSEYYMGSELRFSKPVPAEFYAGHSYRVKKQ